MNWSYTFLRLAARGASLSNSIYRLGWGKLFSFPLSSRNYCDSSYYLMLMIYLLVLGVVYQVDYLGATKSLLVVSQGEYSFQFLALHWQTCFWSLPLLIYSFYKILKPGWIHRGIGIINIYFLCGPGLDGYPVPGAK